MRRLRNGFDKESQHCQCPRKSRVKHTPRAERPVVPIHSVGEFARFGTRQRIAHVAIGVERKTTDGKCQLEPNQKGKGSYEPGYFSSLW